MKTTRKQWRRLSLIMGIVLLTSLVFATGALADSRPLSDWLSQQGQQSTFIPPDPDFDGWNISTAYPLTPFASIDYAGLATNAYVNSGNNPVITGTVNETDLLNGEAQVTVNLQTKNANAWLMYYDFTDNTTPEINQFATNPTVFGNRPSDVLGGAPQALADCSLTLIFHNSGGLGATLPDMVRLVGNYDPNGVPQSDYIYYLFSATALGLGADGTPDS